VAYTKAARPPYKCHFNENSRSQITLSHGCVAISGKLREKSPVLSRRLKDDRELRPSQILVQFG